MFFDGAAEDADHQGEVERKAREIDVVPAP
jgi:hypothetical protein